MALSPGTRLGPYEVLSALGAGGMGEVYKARDTRLSRTVAIKVLPADTATDAAARARFEREARAIATLSHPHICVVHDVGHQDGIDYLVMELLEGETLAERLARAKGPLPLDEVLKIGTAIADALDKAHRAGIIHRDLKPLNVMLTKSGPKLLDFGLAKLHQANSPVSLSNETGATTAGPGTAKGTILGTIHYMSPEQVEGREADTRGDIWALGVVLYELATGTRPFDGESPASVLGAIMQGTPAPLSARQPLTPASLDHLVQRCLEKAPDDRWQSAGDIRTLLSWMRHSAGADAKPSAVATAGKGNKTAWIAAAVSTVAALALALPASRSLRSVPLPAAPETRLELVTPPTDDPLSFALSPDGRQVVFAATSDGVSRLWLRSLSATSAQPLPGTEGGAFPFWSPDGRSLAFVAGGSLKRLDIGGSVRTLAAGVGVGGGSWSSAGVIAIFYSSGGTSLMQLPAEGGTLRPLTTVTDPRQSSHRWPWFLPDGRRFLFYSQGSADVLGIYLGSLDGGEPTRLIAADSSPVFLPSGWILYIRGTTLVGQRIDLERATLVGDPVPVADGLFISSRFAQAPLSTSATGMIAYRTGVASRRQLTWFGRPGNALGTATEPDVTGLETPRLSADGRQLGVGRSPQNNQDVWLIDGGRSRRFTFSAGIDRFPIWSPDGARIAFMSNRRGPLNLFTRLTSGAGDDELLVDSEQVKVPTSWSADGRFLLFHSLDPKAGADIWVVPTTGQHNPSVFLKTPAREAWAVFSPDNRWVAYQSSESGQAEVYVRAFTPPDATSSHGQAGTLSTGGQWQISTAGGIFPVWRHDGRELFFLDQTGAMMAAEIDTSNGAPNAGAPTRLFTTHIVGGAVGNQVDRQFDVAPDGRFLINTELETPTEPITLLMNWNPDGKK